MGKNFLALTLALVTLLGCGCAVSSADVTRGEAALNEKIISSDDAVLVNASADALVVNLTASEMAYVKQLVDDEAENNAIRDYAKQVYDK